jgi:thioredoxin 1
MSHVLNATAGDFSKVVLESNIPVLVDFWAPWCRPCQMMAPVLDDVSESLHEKLSIVKVNVDEPENAALAQQYEIRSIPNMKLFKGGKVVKEIVGLHMKEDLLREMEGSL